MIRIGPSLDRLGDGWRYALVGGLASVPFTAASYWQTGSELSVSPVFFGGLLAGYLAGRATGDRTGVGARAGLVGALPVLWMLTDILLATSALAGPAWFVAADTALVVLMGGVFALLCLAVAALVGAVGGRVGGWLAGVVGPRRPPTVGS